MITVSAPPAPAIDILSLLSDPEKYKDRALQLKQLTDAYDAAATKLNYLETKKLIADTVDGAQTEATRIINEANEYTKKAKLNIEAAKEAADAENKKALKTIAEKNSALTLRENAITTKEQQHRALVNVTEEKARETQAVLDERAKILDAKEAEIKEIIQSLDSIRNLIKR